ncbi:BMP family ABC transporter substrate-binding protein, partial [Clostridium sp. CCUG 7971]|uniref:BMP family ABC transporter substrate-binding protein n=1 Tax=Clostridium sp. CCUG 7971 TaxID=2811414 RepID=UPI001ABA05D0
MKFKKILCLIMVAIVSSLALIGCTGNKGNDDKINNKVKVTMITGVGGINDRSFNQSSWEGLQKAKKDLGVEVGYIESNQDSEYTANIETAVDDGNDLIIGVGFKLKDAILSAAKNYPDQKFAIVDADYEDKTPNNVTCITFSEEQAGYVVGLVAGKMTKTNKVGFIGGIKGVVIKRFEVGYKAGVKEANPNAKVIDQYANTFTDSAKGKSIAQQMYANGADIIFSAAGDVGLGAIEVAKEQGKFAIGVDRDQNEVAPNTVITSAMKKV